MRRPGDEVSGCVSVVGMHRSSGSLLRAHAAVGQAKKFPLVMDFDKCVEQMDRQQLHTLTESVQVRGVVIAVRFGGRSFRALHSFFTDSLRAHTQGIRNNYLLILDKIQKNRDRLTAAAKGRDRHTSGMVC